VNGYSLLIGTTGSPSRRSSAVGARPDEGGIRGPDAVGLRDRGDDDVFSATPLPVVIRLPLRSVMALVLEAGRTPKCQREPRGFIASPSFGAGLSLYSRLPSGINRIDFPEWIRTMSGMHRNHCPESVGILVRLECLSILNSFSNRETISECGDNH